jgi:polar amino acid transport system permease protein
MLELDFLPVVISLDQLLLAGVNTVWIAVAGMVAALACGILGAAGANSRSRWLRRLSTCYVDGFRGTPLLIQILLFFYLPPAALGVRPSPVPVGIAVLGAYFGAYVTEILRGALRAIPAGHTDAAHSLGMSPARVFRRVVLPQVFAIVVPPLAGQFTSLVKATSLLTVIAVPELTLRGRFIMTRTLAPLETWLVIAGIYLLINWTIALGSVALERRLRYFL